MMWYMVLISWVIVGLHLDALCYLRRISMDITPDSAYLTLDVHRMNIVPRVTIVTSGT